MAENPRSTLADAGYRKEYDFATTYTPGRSERAYWFERVLKEFANKKACYLEIGLAEGASFFWVAENILTHPDSRAIGIDVFTKKEVADRFSRNLEISGLKDRITIMRGKSQVMLRQVPVNSVDAIFIDGSHKTRDVLQDAVLCWKILRANGIMVFDDYYGWGVRAAVDIFADVFRDSISRECLDDITKKVLTEKIYVIRKW